MARTYRGASLLKRPSYHQRCVDIPQASRLQVLDIEAMHGEVHRFEGVIDRYGSALLSTGIIQTVCVRNLRLCRTGQDLSPDHWWFRLRSEWMALCLMPGDRVVFTAKVQRCSKGWDAPFTLPSEITHNGRRQVIGLAGSVRDLVLKSRAR